MGFLSFFKGAGKLVGKGFSIATGKGLKDEIVQLALLWVRVADKKYITNPEKRAFVLQILINKGIPESIARIAIEFAVNIFHEELEKLAGKVS